MNYIAKLSTATKVKLGLIIILAAAVVSLLMAPRSTPDSILFPLKRVQEQIFLKFKTNPTSQVEYLSSLLNSRLEELSIMAASKDHSYVLPSSSRYSSTAGTITQLIIDHRLANESKMATELFSKHKQVLGRVLENYPKDTDTERKYIEDDINYLSIYIQQLSNNLSASK